MIHLRSYRSGIFRCAGDPDVCERWPDLTQRRQPAARPRLVTLNRWADAARNIARTPLRPPRSK